MKGSKKTYGVLCLMLVSVLSYSQAVVIIDAGHGYNSNCTNGDGRTETEINTAYEVADRLHDQLNNTCGYSAIMTRNSNSCGSQLSLVQRVLMANSWGGDAFLSVHCNALSAYATGTETFWCDYAAQPDAQDEAYATLIQNEMAAQGQWNSRRVAEDHSYLNFHLSVLRDLDMHGALNEIGFVTSSDSLKLLSNSWRNQFANAYYDAITTYLQEPCNSSPLDCSNAAPLTCGDWFVGSESTAPSQVGSYGCNNWSETGPERVHSFSLSTTTDVTFALRDYTGDLDAYIISDCLPDNCQGITYSQGAVAYDLPAGDYQLVVDADDGSGSGYELSYFCGEGPELSPTQLDFDASVPENSPSVSISSEFYNLGSMPSGDFKVYYYLSDDPQASANDLIIDSVIMSNLDPTIDETRNATISLAGIAPGSYWVIMYVDAGNLVAELEEFNNILAYPLTIIPEDITTSVLKNGDEDVFSFYPNPTSGKLTLKTSSKQNLPYRVSVIDAMGRNVANRSIYNRSEVLDLTTQPTGVYELRIENASHSTYQKLVISN